MCVIFLHSVDGWVRPAGIRRAATRSIASGTLSSKLGLSSTSVVCQSSKLNDEDKPANNNEESRKTKPKKKKTKKKGQSLDQVVDVSSEHLESDKQGNDGEKRGDSGETQLMNLKEIMDLHYSRKK